MPSTSIPFFRASWSARCRSIGSMTKKSSCGPVWTLGRAAASRTTSFEPNMTPQHSLGYVCSAWETMRSQAGFSILIIPEGFAEVLVRAVAEDGDDDAGLACVGELPGDLDGGHEVRAGGDPGENRFLFGE